MALRATPNGSGGKSGKGHKMKYVKVTADEARGGDEVYLNGQWFAVKTVGRVGSSVVLIFPTGGRTSGPAHHYLMRREVSA